MTARPPAPRPSRWPAAITRRNKAVLSGGLHPHYRAVCETYARFAGNRAGGAGRRAGRWRGPRGADRRRHGLRRRAEPGSVRRGARLFAAGRSLPHGGCAAGRRRDRNRVAGRDPSARRDGRRYRRRRGTVARQCAQFRRPLCRAVRVPGEIRAADAGAAGRRNRRCRWPARLGADPVDARAAYPPREGDEQHLHQFRPLRAGLHDPPGAARRSGADPAGAAQPCDGGHDRRAARRDPRRAAGEPGLF